MPPFLDFSSAGPWILAGFVLGLLISWLIRKISGVDARRQKEIEALSATVDDARRAHETLTAVNGQLETERARLTAEVNQLSPRAGLVPQFERQNAELKQALSSVQSSADEAARQLAALRDQNAADLAALRQEAEVKGSTAKYYEEEYGRLHAAHQALNKDWTSASGLVSKLQNDYAVASRGAEESTRLRSDVASLRAQIESLNADISSAKAAAKSEVAKVEADANARVNHLQGLISSKDAEITHLKGELSSAPKQDLSGEVSRLGLQIQSLQSDLKASEAAKAALTDEASKLKASLASAPKEDLSGEVSRLNLHVQGLQSDLRASEASRASLAQEADRLKAAMASAPKQDLSGEVQRLSAEIARVNGALEQVRSQERTASMELHSARTDLSQVRTALEETTRILGERHSEVEDLRAKLAAVPDVESYRRFKEALEAANRIASGQSEKS